MIQFTSNGIMPLFNAKALNTQNDLLMQNLMEFYKVQENMDKLLSVIQTNRTEVETNPVSLRIIDWFVTNYAKKFYTIYEMVPMRTDTTDKNTSNPVPDGLSSSSSIQFSSKYVTEHVRFKVYNDYKLKLKAYSKRRFDPFCRWERIQIPFQDTSDSITQAVENEGNTQYLETTIGQLNFFKWAIEHHILDYIQTHYVQIEHDMNTRNTNSKRRNSSETSTGSSDSLVSTNSAGSCEPLKSTRSFTEKIYSLNETEVLIGDSGAPCSKTRKKREELSISACKCIKKETVKILVKFS